MHEEAGQRRGLQPGQGSDVEVGVYCRVERPQVSIVRQRPQAAVQKCARGGVGEAAAGWAQAVARGRQSGRSHGMHTAGSQPPHLSLATSGYIAAAVTTASLTSQAAHSAVARTMAAASTATGSRAVLQRDERGERRRVSAEGGGGSVGACRAMQQCSWRHGCIGAGSLNTAERAWGLRESVASTWACGRRASRSTAAVELAAISKPLQCCGQVQLACKRDAAPVRCTGSESCWQACWQWPQSMQRCRRSALASGTCLTCRRPAALCCPPAPSASGAPTFSTLAVSQACRGVHAGSARDTCRCVQGWCSSQGTLSRRSCQRRKAAAACRSPKRAHTQPSQRSTMAMARKRRASARAPWLKAQALAAR